MARQHIGIGLSGGIDSCMAATLLLEQGYRVSGFFMLLPLPDVEDQVEQAQQVANHLDIPLHLVDLKEEFQDRVIRYFMHTYRSGSTPNPCVVCNAGIKFGRLFSVMQKHNVDLMATGHYARIGRFKGRPALLRGVDPTKDQSYFLCRLSPDQLARTLFPLGGWHKEEVRAKAGSLGFPEFDRGESQDVCFLARTSLATFLAAQGLRGSEGEIVSEDGTVVGTHRGIWHYTIGQRRGLGIPDATPWYVVALDPQRNRIVVAKGHRLLRRRLLVRELLGSIPDSGWQGLAQLRSRHRAAAATIDRTGPDKWTVTFLEPQRAITPGQFCVFYQDDRVVGSAVIDQ